MISSGDQEQRYSKLKLFIITRFYTLHPLFQSWKNKASCDIALTTGTHSIILSLQSGLEFLDSIFIDHPVCKQVHSERQSTCTTRQVRKSSSRDSAVVTFDFLDFRGTPIHLLESRNSRELRAEKRLPPDSVPKNAFQEGSLGIFSSGIPHAL